MRSPPRIGSVPQRLPRRDGSEAFRKGYVMQHSAVDLENYARLYVDERLRNAEASRRASQAAGDAALLVVQSDHAALAAAIQRVITEQGLAENLRSLGKAQAARFTWDQCAKQTVGLYRSILTKRT